MTYITTCFVVLCNLQVNACLGIIMDYLSIQTIYLIIVKANVLCFIMEKKQVQQCKLFLPFGAYLSQAHTYQLGLPVGQIILGGPTIISFWFLKGPKRIASSFGWNSRPGTIIRWLPCILTSRSKVFLLRKGRVLEVFHELYWYWYANKEYTLSKSSCE